MKRNYLTEEVGWFNAYERREYAMTDPIAAARNALGLDHPPRKYRGLGNEAHAREANMQIGAARAALEGRVNQVASAISAAEARVREECAKIADKAAADAANDAGIARSEGNIGAEERRLCEREKAEAIAAAIRAGGGR